MTQPDEPMPARCPPQPLELCRQVVGGEVRPPDDTGEHRLGVGESQQVERLTRRVAGLDDDGCVDTVRAQDRPEFLHAEGAVEHRERLCPRLRMRLEIPQVDVGVEHPRHERGRSRRPAIPPSTASDVPVVDRACGEAR